MNRLSSTQIVWARDQRFVVPKFGASRSKIVTGVYMKVFSALIAFTLACPSLAWAQFNPANPMNRFNPLSPYYRGSSGPSTPEYVDVLKLGNVDGDIYAYRCRMELSSENKLVGPEKNCKSLGILTRRQIEDLKTFEGTCSDLSTQRLTMLGFLGFGSGLVGFAVGMTASYSVESAMFRNALIGVLVVGTLGVTVSNYLMTNSCSRMVSTMAERLSNELYNKIPNGYSRAMMVDYSLWPMLKNSFGQNAK